MTDRYTESVNRVATPSRLTGPTHVRTNETNVEGLSPTSETSRFVTRTRAYGFEVWS